MRCSIGKMKWLPVRMLPHSLFGFCEPLNVSVRDLHSPLQPLRTSKNAELKPSPFHPLDTFQLTHPRKSGSTSSVYFFITPPFMDMPPWSVFSQERNNQFIVEVNNVH